MIYAISGVLTLVLSVTVVGLLIRNFRTEKKLDKSHERLMSSYDSLGEVVGEMSEFVDRIEGSVRSADQESHAPSGTGRGSAEEVAFTTRWIEAAALRRFLELLPNIGMRTGFIRETCPACGSVLGRELPWADRYRGGRTTEIQPMGVADNLAFEGDAERTIRFPAVERGAVIGGRPGVMAGGAPFWKNADEPNPVFHHVYPRSGWEPVNVEADEPDLLAFYNLDLMYGGSEYRSHRVVVGPKGNLVRQSSFARGQMMGRHGSGIGESIPSS